MYGEVNLIANGFEIAFYLMLIVIDIMVGITILYGELMKNNKK